MYVHYTNKYQSSLLKLHIKLVCAFITQMIARIQEWFTGTPYKAGSLALPNRFLHLNGKKWSGSERL